MAWFVGVGMVLGALLIACGIASLRTGWVPPWVRRRVTRPRLFGLGALLVGVPEVVQGPLYFQNAFGLSWEVRFLGCNVLTFAGLALLAAGQLLPPKAAAHRDGR